MTSSWALAVARDDLYQTALLEGAVPEIADGEVLLRVDRVGVTANNVTYALLGESFRYWDFFPTEPGWGLVPLWGFAEVVASADGDVQVGGRVYGYLPPASHLVVRVGRPTARGFRDISQHRAHLPSPYNFYALTSGDLAYEVHQEDLLVLYRPLFFTAFMLADRLEDNGFFGAEGLALSSASSKTGYAAAFLLRGKGPQVVGLTSAGNVAFTESLGCYDRVLPYDAAYLLSPAVPTAYLDLAGSAQVRARLRQHLGERLVHEAVVGVTHQDRSGTEARGGRRRRQPAARGDSGPSGRLGRGDRHAVRASHVGVPEGTALRDPALGAEIHEDDPEPLGVPLGPLEVVQERPDEVAAQVHPGTDGAPGGVQVAVQVADPLEVVDNALRGDVVMGGGAVLGDVQRQAGRLGAQPDQQLVQSLGIDQPAHGGQWHAVRVDVHAVTPVGHRLLTAAQAVAIAQPDHVRRVVVHAEKVDRLLDLAEITAADDLVARAEIAAQGGWVAALQERLKEHAVDLGVDLRREAVRRRLGRAGRRQGQRDPHLARVGPRCPDGLGGAAMGEQQVVGHLGGLLAVGDARRVLAGAVAE